MSTITVKTSDGEVKVSVVKKNVKSIRLIVKGDGSVTVTAPRYSSDAFILKFVSAKSEWIAKHLKAKREKDRYNDNLIGFKDGDLIRFLGKDACVKFGDKLRIILNEEENKLYLPVALDEKKLEKVFSTWWRETLKSIVYQLIDGFMSVFAAKNVPRPAVVFKKMKSMWGRCNRQKRELAFSDYLLKADILAIEYVVFHELTHLIYAGHGKDFYGFIAAYMPDYKKRIALLKKEVTAT